MSQHRKVFLVRSGHLITLNKCHKGHKSLESHRSLYVKSKSSPVPGGYLVVPGGYLVVLMEVGRQVGMQVGRSILVRSCLLVSLIKCPKGHKCVGSLCRLVKTLIVSSVRPVDQGTRSPIELFWTAKKLVFSIRHLFTKFSQIFVIHHTG